MKKIFKIQSISDVVTNSSSELFIMYKDDADDIWNQVPDCDVFEPVTFEYIKNHATDDDLWEMICDLIHKDYSETGAVHYPSDKWYLDYWERPDRECWEIFLEENKEAIQENIVSKNYYAIEFDDHFENAWEVNNDARSRCITERNHH